MDGVKSSPNGGKANPAHTPEAIARGKPHVYPPGYLDNCSCENCKARRKLEAEAKRAE